MTMFCVSPPRFVELHAVAQLGDSTSARTTPRIEPEPPKMSTPPSTTAVTTSSSEPSAASARAEPK